MEHTSFEYSSHVFLVNMLQHFFIINKEKPCIVSYLLATVCRWILWLKKHKVAHPLTC